MEEVAGVVSSIISAFGSARALYQRMLGKKRTGKGRLASPSEVDAWLRESLDNRPLEISRFYQQHVRRHGHRYERGDSIAHSSLAHTLLTLNSGLIKVINRFLARDSKTDELSRRTLLSLSEVAAEDTLKALSQLSLRLNFDSTLAAPTAALKTSHRAHREKRAHDKKGEEVRLKGGSSKAAAVASNQKSRPPTLLVRGAWVRPKTTSNSKSSSACKHQNFKADSALVRVEGTRAETPKSKHKGQKKQRQQSPRTHPAARSTPCVVDQRWWLSEAGRGEGEEQEEEEEDVVEEQLPSRQAMQDDVFLHPAPGPKSRRPRPISSTTIYTASTKIGEIPESRSRRQLHPVAEYSYDPRLVEYLETLPERSEPSEPPRKISRGIRFWKRERD